jgi:hypothetical protein
MGEAPANGGEAAEQEERDEDFAEERHGAGVRAGFLERWVEGRARACADTPVKP